MECAKPEAESIQGQDGSVSQGETRCVHHDCLNLQVSAAPRNNFLAFSVKNLFSVGLFYLKAKVLNYLFQGVRLVLGGFYACEDNWMELLAIQSMGLGPALRALPAFPPRDHAGRAEP